MNRSELVDKWVSYVFEANPQETRELVDEFPERRHFGLDYTQLGVDYEFTSPLLSNPDEAFSAGRTALARVADEMGLRATDADFETVYFRIRNLPEVRQTSLADLRSAQLGELVSFPAHVAEVGPVRPRLVTAAFVCDVCDEVTARLPQPGRMRREVDGCPNCTNIGFVNLAPERSEYVDTQEVAVRPPGRDEADEATPVVLEHDLAEQVASGDEVCISGIPRARPQDESTVFERYVEAVDVTVRDDP